MATIRHSNRRIQIPLEICGLICQTYDLSQNDLYSLSLVSCSFSAEARRILYESVALLNDRSIQKFCITVLNSPDLVKRLHTLEVHLPRPHQLQVDDTCLLDQVLDICVNLKHLSVQHQCPHLAQNLASRSTLSWLLQHNFQLKSFSTNYFAPWVLANVLKNQPEIEELTIESGTDTLETDPVFSRVSLPKLKRLSCTYPIFKQLLSKNRACEMKLEQLHLTFIKSCKAEEAAAMRCIAQFSETLKCLSVIRYQCSCGHDVGSLILCISENLPDLKFLRVLDYTLLDSVTESNPPVYLPQTYFNDLETLIILSTRTRLYPSLKNGYNPTYESFCHESKIEDHADVIMYHIPTVNRVVLITNTDVYEYTRATVPEKELPEEDPHEWPLMGHKVKEYEDRFGCQWVR